MIAWQEEPSFRIQIVCGVAVLFLSWVFHISTSEFLIILLLIGVVLATEALNTALEELCDMLKKDPDPHIAKIKDLGAAASLLVGIAGCIIGCVIFIPHLLALL